MTERLKQLLDGEAHDLPVPPPAANAVIRQGRSIRRRSRIAAGACGAAAAVIIGGSVVALSGGGSNQAGPDPAAPGVSGNAVFSYGNQVFYDGPGHRAEIQDNAVKSLYYTSAGVLVRHGDNPYSDGGGPQRFSLVTPDGTVQRLGLVTEETVHASDPDQPYVVYGEAVDGELEVVVYNVTEDAEEARVTVGPTTETWFPVSIDGDTVYVWDRSVDETFEVDWNAGTAEASDVDAWGVAGGRVPGEVDGNPAVLDAATGDVIFTVDKEGYFNLSPDGRYAELFNEEETVSGDESDFEVYDVDAGTSVTYTGPTYDWGWTTDGDRFHVGKNEVRTCDSETGECTTQPYAKPNLPEPEPVTETFSYPVCPAGNQDCYSDEEFMKNCSEHPDQCEMEEQVSVNEMTNELKLGGRTYES